ncbi:FTR1 family iron permease [Verminephrobacter eiseniae]|uniref:FTR1 family iron permease n=1 Tax=Verminephrobacter eiseniae TaxID=364317 RepID=UPI002237E5B9|nr:FTR1 family protein [Verminephrobacter eiseniae]MCW5259417.1 FTR1 family iron permease [Verminephrobacter eiseniae]
MGQILFVMWRETVEAMLVVGILHAWLAHDPSGRRGKKYLWLGVLAGLALALLLGLGIEAMGSILSDEGQEYFQAAMLLVAAALIVQMVFWMRMHGRRLKQDLEQSLSRSTRTQHWWGVFSLAAIAVAREGSETVVYLSSLAMGENGFASPRFWLASALGVVLAGTTFYLLQLGGKLFSWRIFFQLTEILLLLFGCALLMNGVEKLMDMQLLPVLKSQVWDSSMWLDDGSIFGGIVSSFTGYRSRPALMSLLVFSGYWLAITGMLKAQRFPGRQ